MLEGAFLLSLILIRTLVVNLAAYNHLKGISRRKRHRDIRHWYFSLLSPHWKQCITLRSKKLFCDRVFIFLLVYKHMQIEGVNWFSDKSERDWLIRSIDTFWLANALEERRAIAERHSTEVECLKKCTWKDTNVKKILYYVNTNSYPKFDVNILQDDREKCGKLNSDKRKYLQVCNQVKRNKSQTWSVLC